MPKFIFRQITTGLFYVTKTIKRTTSQTNTNMLYIDFMHILFICNIAINNLCKY